MALPRCLPVALVALALGCRRPIVTYVYDDVGPEAASPSTSTLPGAEEWASKPKASWPQLVLTNRATWSGHSALEGASAFLVRDRSGRPLAATAKHLIGAMGGVTPPLAVKELDGALQAWILYPRTKSQAAVALEKLATAGLEDDARDWLVLTLKTTENLPATPLKMRDEPVLAGERISLVGCPYSEEMCV